MKKLSRQLSLSIVFCLLLNLIPAYANDTSESTELMSTAILSSSHSTSYPYANVYDGKSSSLMYIMKSTAKEVWFMAELKEPSVLTKVSYTVRGDNYSLSECTNIIMEAANKEDFSDAVELGRDTRGASELTKAEKISFDVESMETYKYVRVRRRSNVMTFSEMSVEGYCPWDSGIDFEADSDGYYAFIPRLKSYGGSTAVNVVTNSFESLSISLDSSSSLHLPYYTIIKAKKGTNHIDVISNTGSYNMNGYGLVKLSGYIESADKEFLEEINSANSAEKVREVLTSSLDMYGVDYEEALSGIFYDKPVYENMADKNYMTLSEAVTDFLIEAEMQKLNPEVKLIKDSLQQTELSSGSFTVSVKSKRLKEPARVVAAVYEGSRLAGVGYKDTDGTNSVEIPLDVSLKGDGEKEFKIIYVENFDTIRPIDAYPDAYEHIYLAPSGKIDGNGSKENPFGTLEKVKERIDGINDSMTGDIIVHIADGTYPIEETLILTDEHSGKNGYKVIFTGDGDSSNPVISGGVEVKEWEPYKNGIYMAPLKDMGDVRNLYVNGLSAYKAQSESYYTLDEMYDDPDTEYVRDGFYTTMEETAFKKPNELELIWDKVWQRHRTPVESIEKADGRYLFKMTQPAFGKVHSTKAVDISLHDKFYISNALELVDSEGEFYYDKTGGYIYYYPRENEDLSSAKTFVPKTEGLIKLCGTSHSLRAENIEFRNIDFSHGAWNDVSEYGLIGTQADSIMIPDTGNGLIPAQLDVRHASGIVIENCTFSDMGSSAVGMTEDVHASVIRGNIFTDISGSGIMAGSPSYSRYDRRICADIKIENNVFRRIANEYWQCTAIGTYFANSVTISHNDIDSTPYSGMTAGWGWGVNKPPSWGYYNITRNKVTNAMQSLHDGGLVYMLGDLKAGVFSGNCLAQTKGRGGTGIYMDSGSANINAFDNGVINSSLWFTTPESYAHDISLYNNYSTTSNHKIYDTSPDNISAEDAVIIDADAITGDALAICNNAGLEAEYASNIKEASAPDWYVNPIYVLPSSTFVAGGILINAVDYYDYGSNAVKKGELMSINQNGWVTYTIPELNAGEYELFVTGRTGSSASTIDVYLDNTLVINDASLSASSWVSIKESLGTLNLTKAQHTIKLVVVGSGMELISLSIVSKK